MKKHLLKLSLAASLIAPAAAIAQNTFPFPATGNVGLGTTVPRTTLEVAGNGSTTPGYHNASIIDNIAIGHKIEGGSRINYIHSADNVPIAFQTTHFPNALYLRDDGLVGIGTANPLNLLTLEKSEGDVAMTLRNSVHGMSVTAGLDYSDSSKFKISLGGDFSNPVMTVDNGRVGFGTTSPQAMLDVNGPARVSGQLSVLTLALTSDRNQKQDFKDVAATEILAKVAALPITTWEYTNAPGVRHIGTMAQCFKAAFPDIGEDDKHIGAGDADGVALAAIKGLYELVQEKDSEIAALKREVAGMKQELASTRDTMADCLARFEKAMEKRTLAPANLRIQAAR